MYTVVICLATVVVGIDAGWQPLPEGGTEYLIQIEPHLLEGLRSGELDEVISSQIPPNVKNVRAFRISVGDGALPRLLPDPEQERPLAEPAVFSTDPGGKPIDTQQAAFEQKLDAKPKDVDPEETVETSTPKKSEDSRPWLVLMVTVCALAASLGGNVYLGMLTRDARCRCRSLLGSAS
jgi:hypothetical protein